MGCLIQLFIRILGEFLWFFVINPIITILFFLKDIGLIWSIGFYVITHYLFLDTFFQDYRIFITALLLIPFIIKVIRQLSLTITRFSMWRENRRLKKSKNLETKLEEKNYFKKEEEDNHYEE